MSRILISAAHKSSGKTMLSIGLAACLASRGEAVQTFKKGPDYIDPLWLAQASGRPCYNLDFNTQSHDEIRALFASRALGDGINLIEGNKGLHDGVDLEGADASAALARLLDAPILLVVDTTGMTRGIAPLLHGLTQFEPGLHFAGVVLNQVMSTRQESKLRQAVEHYTELKILGAMARAPAVIVKERHLGLTTPGDVDGPQQRIERIRDIVCSSVDVPQVIAAARAAPALPKAAAAKAIARPDGPRIGIARDEAFCFYYQDDLEALEDAGATLVPFSPLRDARLPEIDALVLGGGFPETHISRLQANQSLRRSILAAARAGLPIHAECGGLMYLCRSLRWGGQSGEMVGLVPAEAVMHERPQGRGLVVLEETDAAPWSQCGVGGKIPAHEFHYARLEGLPHDSRFAYRVRRGEGIDGDNDGIVIGNTVASFSHLRHTSRSRWAEQFVNFVRARVAGASPSIHRAQAPA